MWNKFFPFRKDNHPERAKTNSNRHQGYKAFSMLNSAEHKICPANKSQITNNSKFFGAEHSWAWKKFYNLGARIVSSEG